MFRSRRFRVALAATGSLAVVLGAAGPAFAHISADPPAVEAGKSATVTFSVEHGCEGSPTTGMEIQLPEGSTDAKGIDGAGFTANVDGRVVSFIGGSVAPTKSQGFEVTFTPPAKPGDVPVKVIQKCAKGELDWIEVAAKGEAEPEMPAPVVKLTDGPPTAAELGSSEHAAEDEHADEHSDDHDAEHDHAATTSEHDDTPGTGQDAAETPRTPTKAKDDSSPTSPIIAGIVAAVVVIAGGALLLMRRNNNKAA